MSVIFLIFSLLSSEPFALGGELKEIEFSPKSDESKGIQSPGCYKPPLKSAFSPPLSFSPLCKHRLYNELIAPVAEASTCILGHDSVNVGCKGNSPNKSPTRF